MPRGIPPVGLNVQFFIDGTKTCEPQAAVVIRSYQSGMCDLKVLPPGTALPKCYESVFMFGDPSLQEEHRKTWADLYGVWDYIPGAQKLGFVSDKELKTQAEEAELAKLQQQEEAQKRRAARQLQTA